MSLPVRDSKWDAEVLRLLPTIDVMPSPSTEEVRTLAEGVVSCIVSLSKIGCCYVAQLADGPALIHTPVCVRFVPRTISPPPRADTRTEEP